MGTRLYLTEGKPLWVIFRFMLPMLACNLLQQFYTLIHTALAAVGATTFLCNLLLACATGLTSGFAILSAQDWGESNQASLRETVSAAFALAAVFSIVLTAAGLLLLDPVLRLLGTPEEIFLYSRRFLLVNLLGQTAWVFYNLATALLRSVGKSSVPLAILTCSLGINFLLALLFLLVLGWGVTGAALATVAAQLLSAAVSWGYLVCFCPELRFGPADLRRVQRRKVYRLLRAGLAMLPEPGGRPAGAHPARHSGGQRNASGLERSDHRRGVLLRPPLRPADLRLLQ